MSLAASPIDALFDRIRQIDGFLLACLVDGTSGMMMGSVQEQGDLSVPVAGAGACDVVNVLSLMTGELALKGDLEDVIVTLTSHYHLIRKLEIGSSGPLVLLVTLDKPQTNLAMALREVRDLTASLT
jgi:hypothetical protein